MTGRDGVALLFLLIYAGLLVSVVMPQQRLFRREAIRKAYHVGFSLVIFPLLYWFDT